MLFKVQRHSDHHMLAYKPYQSLDFLEKAPELPLGYTGMMMIAFCPPVWRYVMDPLLEANIKGEKLSPQVEAHLNKIIKIYSFTLWAIITFVVFFLYGIKT